MKRALISHDRRIAMTKKNKKADGGNWLHDACELSCPQSAYYESLVAELRHAQHRPSDLSERIFVTWREFFQMAGPHPVMARGNILEAMRYWQLFPKLWALQRRSHTQAEVDNGACRADSATDIPELMDWFKAAEQILYDAMTRYHISTSSLASAGRFCRDHLVHLAAVGDKGRAPACLERLVEMLPVELKDDWLEGKSSPVQTLTAR